ncbi:DMT family transporter [Aliishimia ponticola]|uniref:DMT family transporter n=2 Tax=Aliishimia ponticola TaxID=2499833 RepID=A0A4S4NCN2_9RHOB|nr:DMT family transporter [Aliishimia ponticola]
MLVTGLCFVAVTALVKMTGNRIPATESAFLRYLLGLVFLIPLLRGLGGTRLTPRHWRLFVFRGICHSCGVILWFFAMTRIPISEVTAMNYLSPVYVSIGAVFVLGEKLAIRRIMAIVAALIGVLVILRPGVREIEDGHLAMLICAVVFAAGYLTAKILADEVPAALVVGMLSIFVTLFLAPFAIAVWVPPTWEELGLLFLVACFATAGHYTMTLAFAAAPMTVTQPVTFLQLVWATLLGALLFAEPVDIWVVIGGSIILGAVSFITWREAVLKRRPITPPGPATKL